ncbi:MAG: MarR family transcriptional regulator [Candidatus Anstonellaceae archaeon]
MHLAQNKNYALLVALIFIFFSAIIFFYHRTLSELASSTCTDMGDFCPHEKIVETQNLIILFLMFILMIAAWLLYQAYSKKEPADMPAFNSKVQPLSSSGKKVSNSIDISALSLEEKRIIDILKENDGSVFQSDIKNKLGYSKVKVTRLLDKLEQKGIIERKRRGMANLVLLK